MIPHPPIYAQVSEGAVVGARLVEHPPELWAVGDAAALGLVDVLAGDEVAVLLGVVAQRAQLDGDGEVDALAVAGASARSRWTDRRPAGRDVAGPRSPVRPRGESSARDGSEARRAAAPPTATLRGSAMPKPPPPPLPPDATPERVARAIFAALPRPQQAPPARGPREVLTHGRQGSRTTPGGLRLCSWMGN